MGFEYLTNIPLAKAREDYLALLESHGFGAKTEVIPVWDACGRVTAHAVYAHICAPHYAASAMDGIAVRAKHTFNATETTPVTLDVWYALGGSSGEAFNQIIEDFNALNTGIIINGSYSGGYNDTSTKITAALSSNPKSTPDVLIGGQVTEFKDTNRAHGSVTSPVVHYFTIENWASVLDVRISFRADSGVSIRDVQVDSMPPEDEVWKSGSFSAMPYLRRDALGQIAQGEHWVSFLPYGANASDSCGVNSTVTMTVIEKTVS